MQCSHCGKSDWVTIGDQKYCANCGEPASSAGKQATSGSSSAAAASAVSDVAINPDITTSPKPAADGPSLAPAAVVQPQPNSLVSPSTKPATVFSDLAKPSAAAPVRTVNPANKVHAGPAAVAGKGVLDLRAMNIKPPAPEKPAPKVVKVETPVESATPVIAEAPAPAPAPAPVTAPAPTPAPEPIKVVPQTGTATPIQRFNRPETAVAPVPSTPAVSPTLPNAAISQVQNLNRMAAVANNSITPGHAAPIAASAVHTNRPSVKSVAATTLAIALMGGYIWLNNYNAMTVKAAGQQAGIVASLPSFIPSSFTLAGQVATSPGAVTMQFKSPSSPGPLVISQRKTDWNSSSLLEFYVNNKASSYVSVQNQGLTIYLYNNNQATWVNKGLQYTIEGNTSLSREQVLKIAESL